MSFLAVDVVTTLGPKVPAETTDGVVPYRRGAQSPSLPVLPLPLQPLGDHLAGGPLGCQALEPGQRHPGSTALHRVAVTVATGLVHCNINHF